MLVQYPQLFSAGIHPDQEVVLMLLLDKPGCHRPDFERIGFPSSAVLLYDCRNKGSWSRQLRCVNCEHVQNYSQKG